MPTIGAANRIERRMSSRTPARLRTQAFGLAALAAVVVGLPVLVPAGQQSGVFYPDIPGELLLENEYVIVQRFIIEPGQWEGVHSHPGNQIAVRVKGGLWAGRGKGSHTYTSTEPTVTGTVGWQEAIDISEEHDSGNIGDEPMDLIWVTLKPCAPISNHQVGIFYPNIETELLLENERVVVQSFVIEPGQSEGIHSHPGNQLYIQIKAGTWAGRLDGREEYSGPPSPVGEVGWVDAVELSAGHDSSNVGDTPMELVYVTLKPCQPLTVP